MVLGQDESRAWDAACTLADPMVNCHAVRCHDGRSPTKTAAKTQGEDAQPAHFCSPPLCTQWPLSLHGHVTECPAPHA